VTSGLSHRTVLVTGGAGYIGSHAVLELLAGGYEPVILDDFSTGRRCNVPDGVACHVGDVGDGDLVGEILRRHGIVAVMHFAGSIVLPESFAQPLPYYRNNTAKTLDLLAQCVAHDVRRFVFSSTAGVYSGQAEAGPIAEAAAGAPASPYGASKLMIERILSDVSLAHPRLQTVSLRYFNVAGADPAQRSGQSPTSATHLVRAAVETHLGLRPHLEIFGRDYATRDGTCERDYIHVSDLASAHIQALRHLEAGGGSTVVNCGYGHGATVAEVVARLEALTGVPLPIRDAPRRVGDVASIVADTARLKSLFNWTPRYDDLGVILQTALAWRRRELDRVEAAAE
jgi:UDP-glucose 4-epimerase